ncbi:MAG: alpha/beta fold hydrolase [Solirubrobacterales bacterium]|nr:alpha/beta fold hydrolase [Solirubrobacterales bacterium]
MSDTAIGTRGEDTNGRRAVADTGPAARQPDEAGYATADDGLRLYYELHGGGSTTIVLLPPNPISHSRIWKGQIHYLARHHRVLCYDGRGNGKSDHPNASRPWVKAWHASDCLSVMDATGTGTAVLAGICGDGVWPSLQLAATHLERVQGIVAIAPGVPLLVPEHPFRTAALESFEEEIGDPVGWEKFNRRYILGDHRGFLEFFFGEMFPEPHSTKQVEDAVALGLDSSPELLVVDNEPVATSKAEVEEVCRSVRCPVLVIQGDQDNCQPFERGLALVELTGAEHLRLAGAGHIPNARHPVLVNQLIHEFVSRFEKPPARHRTCTVATRRPRRALLVSSPIGLGHAWRDVAVARELRRCVPGLEVHWLAQPPVTRLLAECGEIVHPASAALASEAAGVDAETGEHELHAFQMLRRLDEIFCANFMVFHDLVREEPFDVWIADEAWEVDYFLHENPRLKTSPYVWMSDFVGVLPMPVGGEREQFLAADTNAQMVEHIARYPRLRDASIFVGDREDVVDEPLGPELPGIVEWTEEHFRFAGYITGFAPAEIADRESLRAEFGYRPDERVCIVAAGGSAVGSRLLRSAAAAFPMAKELVGDLRMILIAGPRLDPGSLPHADGLEVHGYVHRLYRQLAAGDIAISHGGLSTTMELTATRRPFLYFPLRHHFEQNLHVHHRLQRYGAGRRMDIDDSPPEAIAAAIADEVGRDVDYLPVATDGAARAARVIAEVL